MDVERTSTPTFHTSVPDMWRQKIQHWTIKCVFDLPASHAQITAAEKLLNVRLPERLHSLLLETNGIVGEYGFQLVWPIERIEADNLSFRRNESFQSLYMPFEHLLFFGDAGNGDQFAFAIRSGAIRTDDVFAWNHEDDSRTWVAPSLDKFLEWWITGKLTI